MAFTITACTIHRVGFEQGCVMQARQKGKYRVRQSEESVFGLAYSSRQCQIDQKHATNRQYLIDKAVDSLL